MVMGIQSHQDSGANETYNAFVQNYAQVRRTIYAFVFVLMGNAADADDVFQEVCVVLWRRFDQFQPGTNFLAWAKQIARNLVMDHRKRRSRRHYTGLDDKTMDMLAARFERIQDQVEDRVEALKHCLDKIEDKDRHLLQATYEQGEPVKRIAKKAQVSVQGIYKRLGNVHGTLLRCVRRTLEERGGAGMVHREARELDAVMMCLLKGRITTQERDQLQNSMAEDLDVLNHCLDFVVLSAGLQWIHQGGKKETVQASDGHLQRGLRVLRVLVPRRTILLTVAKIAAVLVLGSAGIALLVSRAPRQDTRGMAEIVSGLAAKWANASGPTDRGTHLGRGPWHLVEGIAEIRMASGTEVVLRAPCRFSLEGENQVFLTSGGLTARVPDRARGFKVSTDHVEVTDMGTEFGVIAEADGHVEAHVFVGEVMVVPDRTAPSASAVRLGTGMAAAVSATGSISKGPAAEERFIRKMPEGPTAASPGRRLDLADVVGGGNGFGSGTLDQGLNPDDGQIVQSPALRPSKARRSGYIILLGSRYVDGVFTPNVRSGGIAVTSTGLVFAGCPETDGTYCGGIVNGAGMGAVGQGRHALLGRLRGKAYGTGGAPAIRIHPNAGITFDLERIRRDNPGVAILAMRGLCGISETIPGRPASPTDFWVLIDGQVRFHHRAEPSDLRTASIEVPIDARSHYLTLATTCPGSTDNCCALVAEPFLEFGPGE